MLHIQEKMLGKLSECQVLEFYCTLYKNKKGFKTANQNSPHQYMAISSLQTSLY